MLRLHPDIQHLNARQPPLIPKLTADGFCVRLTPARLQAALASNFQRCLRLQLPVEPPCPVVQSALSTIPAARWIHQPRLNAAALRAIQPLAEAWVGAPLQPTGAYGVRVYQRGSLVEPHLTRYDSYIVTAMLVVGHGLEADWPLTLRCRQLHTLSLQGGQLLLFESARIILSHPEPLCGEHFGVLFLHYQPLDWEARRLHVERSLAGDGRPDMIPLPQTLASRYRLEEEIGHGTWGRVYSGTDQETGTPIAVKRLRARPGVEHREFRLLQALRHPNILRYHTHFTDGDGDERWDCLVTERLPTSLHELVRREAAPIPSPRIYGWLAQISAALCVMHDRGVAHCDLKLANILLDPDTDRVVLCDLGSARTPGHKPGPTYICSRHIRSPELLLGWTGYGISVDMWSLGCVLFELTMNRQLAREDHEDAQLGRISEQIPHPSRAALREALPGLDDARLGWLSPLRQPLQETLARAGVDLRLRVILGGLLQFLPADRLTAGQLCAILGSYEN